MLDNNHIEAHGPAQPLAATHSPQPKNNESHFRITRAYREFWQPRLRPASWSLLTALVARIKRTGELYPSHALLAIEANMSIKSVQRHLGYLRDAGAIWWEATYKPTLKGKTKRTSNRYHFGQNDRHQQSEVTDTPRSELPTNIIGDNEVKEEHKHADASKISSNVSEPEPDIAERLVKLGMWRHVAKKLTDKKPFFEIEQQIEWLPLRNADDPAAILYLSIVENWPEPGSEEESRATTPIPTEKGKQVTEKSRSPKIDTGKPVTAVPENPASEPTADVRADAIRCAAVFKLLTADEQSELMSIAKRDVSPIWHDRVGNVESLMSLGLWKLVAERYPERVKG